MPIDYARRSEKYVTKQPLKNTRRNHEPSDFPFLKVMGLVVLISLFIYGLFYISHHKPTLFAKATLTSPIVKVKLPLAMKHVVTNESSQEDQPPPVQFDFYQMLPNMQLNVDAQDQANKASSPSSAVVLNALPDSSKKNRSIYYLQLTSLTDENEAEQFQSDLNQQGFQTVIRSIDRDGTVFYRVQMGPYKDRNEATSTQATLEKQNISSVIIGNNG